MHRGLVLAILLALAAVLAAAAEPIRLHPENPRYFLFRGKPTILLTSAEHYGAVLNQHFRYERYLATLQGAGFNYTRIFTGAYREVPGNFRIASNTLAPAPGRFVAPWVQDGDQWDLARWNEAYFARLRDFVSQASRRGIVVEVTLFCPYYQDSMWRVSPLYTPGVPRTEALTRKHPRLVAVQEAMVRKIVGELREFDNVFYEIANEPYFGGVTLDWQAHIARVIQDTDPTHLIAQNIANGSKKIDDPNPLVSLFNFHYARPPETVAVNWGLNKAIGCDETGFDGVADAPYRIQGWDFLVAGGALYNNLDYSFTLGHEDGSFVFPDTQPGGGGSTLQRQLRILRDFFARLDFLRMAPDASVIRGGAPAGASVRALSQPGKVYVIYVHHGRRVRESKPPYAVEAGPHRIRLELNLPAGAWRYEWLNTKTGKVDQRGRMSGKTLESPDYTEDIALRVAR